jgi:4-hydroxybenzoate polyprenyltransferase
MYSQAIDRQLELVVDLDGTLLRTDLLWESYCVLLGRSPLRALSTLTALPKGKAAFKRRVSQESPIAPEHLPYRESVLHEIREARAQGRQIVLATAADELQAIAIANSLGIFDRVLASDGISNLSGLSKCDAIRRTASDKFEYIGNSRADLPIWRAAESAIVVNPSAGLHRTLQQEGINFRVLRDSDSLKLAAALQAMRPMQWAKNLLLFVPIIMAQHWTDWPAVISVLLTFCALCLAASGTYVLNDLTDVDSDRIHARKCRRPLASGAMSIQTGVALAIFLVAAGLAVGAFAGATATFGVALYVAMSLGYSLVLKKKLLADVIALAGLYVYRVLLGGAVTGVMVSHWLAVFSAFLFLSMAISKRASELTETQQSGQLNTRRGYRPNDVAMLASMGVSSGIGAVLVFCLYITGETATGLYRTPAYLWLAAPALLYWIMRVWMLAERGELRDDPIVFVCRDRVSFAIAAWIAVVLIVAKLAPAVWR